MALKSDRLKKLEVELKDLEDWKRLGLVPAKDKEKHDKEILSIQEKIQEEKERMEFLKENGDMEEYITPKKSNPRQAGYINMPTLPDVDLDESNNNANSGLTDVSAETEAETTEFESSGFTQDQTTQSEYTELTQEDTDEDPFSDANRWKRGIADPDDEDNW